MDNLSRFSMTGLVCRQNLLRPPGQPVQILNDRAALQTKTCPTRTQQLRPKKDIAINLGNLSRFSMTALVCRQNILPLPGQPVLILNDRAVLQTKTCPTDTQQLRHKKDV